MPFDEDGRIDVGKCRLCGSAHRDHLAWSREKRIEYHCPNVNRVTVYEGNDDDGQTAVPARVPRRPLTPSTAVALAVPLATERR